MPPGLLAVVARSHGSPRGRSPPQGVARPAAPKAQKRAVKSFRALAESPYLLCKVQELFHAGFQLFKAGGESGVLRFRLFNIGTDG